MNRPAVTKRSADAQTAASAPTDTGQTPQHRNPARPDATPMTALTVLVLKGALAVVDWLLVKFLRAMLRIGWHGR